MVSERWLIEQFFRILKNKDSISSMHKLLRINASLRLTILAIEAALLCFPASTLAAHQIADPPIEAVYSHHSRYSYSKDFYSNIKGQ
ncbi:MAG: hypothetical protein R3B47_17625 [Bacteroidia bacterium]